MVYRANKSYIAYSAYTANTVFTAESAYTTYTVNTALLTPGVAPPRRLPPHPASLADVSDRLYMVRCCCWRLKMTIQLIGQVYPTQINFVLKS